MPHCSGNIQTILCQPNWEIVARVSICATVMCVRTSSCFESPLLSAAEAEKYCRMAICVITFCVSRRRGKMYCGHARLCLPVRGRTPTLLHGPGCNLGHGRGCPIVVHYWADLQSGHGLRCYGNKTRTLVASLRPSRDMTT